MKPKTERGAARKARRFEQQAQRAARDPGYDAHLREVRDVASVELADHLGDVLWRAAQIKVEADVERISEGYA